MSRKRKYYLFDHSHNSLGVRKYRMSVVASQIALKYGSPGYDFKNFTQQMVNEFWNYPDDKKIPAVETLRNYTTNPQIKWVINNVIQIDQSAIWNNHFLYGVVTNGTLKFHKHGFPSVAFCRNFFEDLVRLSPFGGKIRHYPNKEWRSVPGLCLPYSDKELSFMAGVLAGGEIHDTTDGIFAAYYGERAIAYLKQWKIPIEKEDDEKVLISPIWPALFSKHMPAKIEEKWMNIKKPFGYNVYPVILWHTYIRRNWEKNGLPYLGCKRKIIYEYGGRGALKKIEKMRVERNLIALDNRIKIIVQEWGKQ